MYQLPSHNCLIHPITIHKPNKQAPTIDNKNPSILTLASQTSTVMMRMKIAIKKNVCDLNILLDAFDPNRLSDCSK